MGVPTPDNDAYFCFKMTDLLINKGLVLFIDVSWFWFLVDCGATILNLRKDGRDDC